MPPAHRGVAGAAVGDIIWAVPATTLAVILFMNWLERRYYIPGLIKREKEGV